VILKIGNKMSTKTSAVSLKKPSSVWSRKVKIDTKPLFKAIGKAATHLATLKFEELGNDAIDAATSLGLDTPMEEVAFALIKSSLLDALLTLTKESIAHLDTSKLSDQLSIAVESLLTAATISFDKNFFQKPSAQPFILGIVTAYEQWLCDSGVAPRSANSIANRLPAYFTYALSAEWRRNAIVYKPLLEQRESPFAVAENSFLGWRHYFGFLRKRISENVFDEAFSLDQIYVPLIGYYLEKQDRDVGHKHIFRSKDSRVCVDLESEIKRWIRTGDKSDALRVLSGGPGSGKSSFTRILCCRLAEAGLAKPIYIPLHLIDPTRDVATEVERFIRDEGLLGFNPLDPERKEDSLLLVFDGLDELASMGKVAAQVARDFIQAVEKMIGRRNLGEFPISVIISGRELVIQENETEFRRPRQVLTILPYLVQDDRSSYSDPQGLLGRDLRTVWWSKFGQLTGSDFSDVPLALKVREIDDITAQPLLNYLVALSYRRGRLQFTHGLNLNSVYADLVAAVYERGYEKSKTYGPISHISQRDFARVLEEIGLAAWHSSDGRSSSVKDILHHCQQSGLQSLFKSFTEGAEAGVTKLLAAFFFRRSSEAVGDDATFVFTHKSFGEYLTAIRIIRGVERIVVGRLRRKEDPDDGFDISEALTHWARLTGPAPLTEYIQIFLQREIAQKDNEYLLDLKEVFSELSSVLIDSGIPMERLGGVSFAVAKRQEINAGVSMLIVLNAVAKALQSTIALKFATSTSFGTFLRRILPQRSGPNSPLLFSALSYFDFSGQCLDMMEFYDADLSHTKWGGSRVHFANFAGANLYMADFTSCNLGWSRFDGAEINHTNFSGAVLEHSRFGHELGIHTRIEHSIFIGANLKNSTFVGCVLDDCKFENAKISKSTIHRAQIKTPCDMRGVLVGESERGIILWLDRGNKSGQIKGAPIFSSDSLADLEG